ncbi:ABC transporter ATP-binding protein [Natronomonas salsuginis]|uniref:ATP-binding cassette domain-containing protein n=1 Tax=Natronomonas salsuginis TaxID=2217661 RepID=A0A4U5J8D9_9EURY|nr:oligopeptide/dipeptide ABC transporter ATP-binding protein [Natronomonas salsuginis]TKR24705.1 ATP-binding cassette domain-containing protein [Natronomonas salsuginis]
MTETIGSRTAPADEQTSLVEVRDLKKHFQTSSGPLSRLFDAPDVVRAVDGVNLTIREGETVAVVGESGCGKSTLAKTLLKLHQPTAGSITYRGTDLTDLSQSEMRPFRREMQMIFQDPLGSLNPSKTVGQLVTTPMDVHNIGADSRVRQERARELLERVGLSAEHFDRTPEQLSGGQQQRVGIARALSVEPDFLVADEPTSALDVSVQAKVLKRLDTLTNEHGAAMLFIAHDLSTVRHIADRVAVMYLGRIVECAAVDELFGSPQHPYTKALLSAVPRIDPDDRAERIRLHGQVPSPMNPPAGCRFHTRCQELIPPAEWKGTQVQFRMVFTFRQKVLSDVIDVEAVRTQLKEDTEEIPQNALVDAVVGRLFPGYSADLPSDAHSTLCSAAQYIVDGDIDAAKALVRDEFRTPCERDVPDAESQSGCFVRCHRYD